MKTYHFFSWNVNGIRAVDKNIDFVKTVLNQNYDIIGLQEVKALPQEVPFMIPDHAYFNPALNKRGYSGTAIISKEEPLKVTYGMGQEEHDLEGRIIVAEYEKFFFITVYTPNSKEGLLRLPYRQVWEQAFLKYLKELDQIKPLIICGDLNVAHQEIDLKNPKTNLHNAGFTLEERACFDELLKEGFTDTFRYLYPDTVKYSWWSYRTFARSKGIGWRIDYFLVSNRIKGNILQATIEDQIIGSDHCPVTLTLKI